MTTANEKNIDLQDKKKIEYKVYKTVDEQIEYLKNNKKIIVNDEQKNAFTERNYSSIINPYKEFFAINKVKNSHVYNEETDVSEIFKLIKIDDDFCKLLYALIGTFEKKFKNMVFSNICSTYINCEDDVKDCHCITYVKEINDFLSSEGDDELPRFCKNFKFSASKNGYIEDSYRFETRKDILSYLVQIGTGKKEDGTEYDKKNKLINHYLQKQEIAPLWVLPNALTLGELSIIFGMLNKEMQMHIVSNFTGIDIEKISTKRISSFSGVLEIIRKMRNIVNHYEPIYPYIYNETLDIKKIENSQIYSVLNLLVKNYDNSFFTNKFDNSSLSIEECEFNKKHLRALNLIKNILPNL